MINLGDKVGKTKVLKQSRKVMPSVVERTQPVMPKAGGKVVPQLLPKMQKKVFPLKTAEPMKTSAPLRGVTPGSQVVKPLEKVDHRPEQIKKLDKRRGATRLV